MNARRDFVLILPPFPLPQEVAHIILRPVTDRGRDYLWLRFPIAKRSIGDAVSIKASFCNDEIDALTNAGLSLEVL